MAAISVSLDIESQVTARAVAAPSLFLGAAKWDYTLLQSFMQVETSQVTTVTEHTYGLIDGFLHEEFQSGVISGLNIKEVRNFLPIFKVGEYSINWDRRPLFSDTSISSRLLSADTFELQLVDEALLDSVDVRIFSRNDAGVIRTVKEIVEGDDTTPPSYESNYIIDTNLLLTAYGDCSIVVGTDTTDEDLIAAQWEPHNCWGSHKVFTKFFPIEDVTIYWKDYSGTFTLLTEGQLAFAKTGQQKYEVDYDLGVVTLSGYKNEDLVLKTLINSSATTLVVYNTSEFADYPDQGVILIGAEKIKYTIKTDTGFAGCTRGFDSTSAASHSAGSIISDTQHGDALTGTVYIRYRAVPRVEYEVKAKKERTPGLNFNLQHGVIADETFLTKIASQHTVLNSIELTVDKDNMGGNLSGPLYYGNDVARFTAKALDSEGNPIFELPIYIEVVEGFSGFDGASSTYGISNLDGEVNGFYWVPTSAAETALEVLEVTHDAGDTEILLRSISPGAVPDDFWIFQILKHDPIIGTTGVQCLPYDSGTPAPVYGAGYIDAYYPASEYFVGGLIFYIDDNDVRWSAKILGVHEIFDGNNEPGSRFYIDRSIASGTFDSSSLAWLLEEGSTVWNAQLKNGKRVILYEWDAAAEHPLTEAAGAWVPLKADSISDNALVFSGRELGIPAPEDDTNNLGGYFIIGTNEARFRAWAVDPFSGKIIRSNTLRLSIEVPPYLTGITNGAALIPHGWRLSTDVFNVGAGIGGANFITINPAASGVNQFSLVGVII